MPSDLTCLVLIPFQENKNRHSHLTLTRPAALFVVKKKTSVAYLDPSLFQILMYKRGNVTLSDLSHFR